MRDMLDDARLLIIDDDALTRLLAAEALRESGFTVFEADCGEEGCGCIAMSSRIWCCST